MVSVLHKEEIEMEADYKNIPQSSSRSPAGARGVTPAVPGRKLLRVVIVSFGLLCVLQAALNICLRFTLIHQREENQQLHNSTMLQLQEIKSHNLMRERDQLQNSNNNLTRERDQLQASYDDVTRERDQLQTSYDDVTRERDLLQTLINHLSKIKVLECPSGWEKFQSSCYYISKSQKNWTESRQECLLSGANLVIINSRGEQAFLKDLQDRFWIGLSDLDNEGQWRWVDGTGLTDGIWAPEEPNDEHGGEDCVELLRGINAWNDAPCSDIKHSVCEKLGENSSEWLLDKESQPDERERDQLQTSYNNLTRERDQLQTSYNNLTRERDQLQTSNNNLTRERDQLQTSNNNLTSTFCSPRCNCSDYSGQFLHPDAWAGRGRSPSSISSEASLQMNSSTYPALLKCPELNYTSCVMLTSTDTGRDTHIRNKTFSHETYHRLKKQFTAHQAASSSLSIEMASGLHEEEIEMEADHKNIPLSSSRSTAGARGVTPAVPGRKLLRVVIVSFGLLCVLQAALNIYLIFTLIHQREENQQLHNSTMLQLQEIKSHNLMRERDQLQTSNNNLTRERDQLQTNNNILTSERDQLHTNYTNLTRKRDQLQTSNNNLTSERDQLQTNYNNLTRERDQLQASYDDVTRERDQLQTLINNLSKIKGLRCPLGWKKFQSSCYYVSKYRANWNESRQECLLRGANLVIINSRGEQEFLKDLQDRFWIGLSDLDNEGQWRWVDGTGLAYRIWAPEEPNDEYEGEDCVELLQKFNAWNDASCSAMKHSVCEKLVST
ncbi:uncharacterized protein LOC143016667 [Genypterus blacodes]|uniref:uncharacterized protein LOC143016667 n=1 Tax=Genypterus blacodes TaxID=154954 RepID=UPI003F76E009